MAKIKSSQVLLNKSEVDRIFSYNKIQWSQAACHMTAPGWTLSFSDHQFGMQVVGFDPSTSVGLSVQPYFRDENHPPEMVIIANYFPLGMLPPITNRLIGEMQSLSQTESGEAYSVILRHGIIHRLEIFEYAITEY